jgi:hypothetical protein
MFEFIRDRQQEIALLKYAKLEAQCLKHNIEEARNLEPILKKDGSIHKTKMKHRETIIRGWEKEVKKLRKFFNEHKTGGKPNDWKRYKYKERITNGRNHIEDLFASKGNS